MKNTSTTLNESNSNLHDSIISQKASLSQFEESLKHDKNFLNSKKITINRYLLNKLLNFLHNFIDNFDTTIEFKKTIFQLIDLVKVEESTIYYQGNIENEKYLDLKDELDKLKIENENFKKNQVMFNTFNAELTEEVINFF